jgi:hypothetical protein
MKLTPPAAPQTVTHVLVYKFPEWSTRINATCTSAASALSVLAVASAALAASAVSAASTDAIAVKASAEAVTSAAAVLSFTNVGDLESATLPLYTYPSLLNRLITAWLMIAADSLGTRKFDAGSCELLLPRLLLAATLTNLNFSPAISLLFKACAALSRRW